MEQDTVRSQRHSLFFIIKDIFAPKIVLKH